MITGKQAKKLVEKRQKQLEKAANSIIEKNVQYEIQRAIKRGDNRTTIFTSSLLNGHLKEFFKDDIGCLVKDLLDKYGYEYEFDINPSTKKIFAFNINLKQDKDLTIKI